MDRRQTAAVLALDALGIDLKLDSFDRRLITQKAIYLVQEAGLSLGYHYRWYLRGPYCPSVARDLFSALDDKSELLASKKKYHLGDQSLAKLSRIKNLLADLLDEDQKLANTLELLASTLFLIKSRQVDQGNSNEIHSRLLKFGKSYSPTEVSSAVGQLKSCGLFK